jgi:phosphoglycolate phosphatase
MTIKAVLFDKDGTLVDVNGTWVPFYRAVLAEQQSLSAAEIDAKMALGGFDVETHGFKAGSVLAGGTTRQIVDLWWPELDAAARARKTHALDHDYGALALRHLRPLMPLSPVLAGLKTMGYRLGVATNDGQVSAAAHMRALGVDHFFEAIIGADSVDVPKPSGQMVRLFAARTGLSPEAIAMVGDNTHDLEEAHAGGAGLAIGVLTGNSARDDLLPHAHHVISSVADLAELLNG